MKVIYINEYDEELVNKESSYIPPIGSTVLIDDIDQLVVKEVVWNVKTEVAIVTVGEPKIRKVTESDSNIPGRLNVMDRNIIDLDKRLKASERTHQELSEQLVSVRTKLKANQSNQRKQDLI